LLPLAAALGTAYCVTAAYCCLNNLDLDNAQFTGIWHLHLASSTSTSGSGATRYRNTNV
jgi:hypothetical protein